MATLTPNLATPGAAGYVVTAHTAPLADGSTGFPALAADGTSPVVAWPGGDGAFFALGTFGGGTITLQMLAPDGATWMSLGTAVALTAAGMAGFSAPAGSLRANLAGSSSPSLKAWVSGIPQNTWV